MNKQCIREYGIIPVISKMVIYKRNLSNISLDNLSVLTQYITQNSLEIRLQNVIQELTL